jgi:exopolysaccharide biosynthesis polyprenyl glycosylphosphotransferase
MTRLSLRGAWWRLMLPAVGDIAIFAGSLAAALLLRDSRLLHLDTFLHFSPLFVAWVLAFYSLGLYDMRQVRDFVTLIGNLVGGLLLCGALGVTYFYVLLPYQRLTPKTHLLLTLIISHAAVLGWRRLWLKAIDFQLLNQKIVFLGDEIQVKEVEQAVRKQYDSGFYPINWTWPGVDMVVADAEWVEENWDKAKAIFLAAVKHGVPVVSLGSFYESVFGKVSPFEAGRPTWALSHVLPRTNGFYWKAKRAIDLIVSAALLTVLSPLLLLIAAAVWITSGRPIFYGQRRLGFLGKPFIVFKFRTMGLSADMAGPFISANEDSDQRITRLGRILRRFRLDELPQLWNVLCGEMSLIGPRPEWVREIAVLEKSVPNYHLRHLVMPGITGWAQVYFRATSNLEDALEKLHYDLYYAKYISFALDFTILLKTFKRIFVKDSRVVARPAPMLRFRQTSNWAGEALAQSAD